MKLPNQHSVITNMQQTDPLMSLSWITLSQEVMGEGTLCSFLQQENLFIGQLKATLRETESFSMGDFLLNQSQHIFSTVHTRSKKIKRLSQS